MRRQPRLGPEGLWGVRKGQDSQGWCRAHHRHQGISPLSTRLKCLLPVNPVLAPRQPRMTLTSPSAPPSPRDINRMRLYQNLLPTQVPCSGALNVQQLLCTGIPVEFQCAPFVQLPACMLSSPLPFPVGLPVGLIPSGTWVCTLPAGPPQNPQAALGLFPLFPDPHFSHSQFTKPSPDTLNPSFIVHSSLVLHKSQRLRNFLRSLKRHGKVPWAWVRHVGWCLLTLAQGWKITLLLPTGPFSQDPTLLSGQMPRTEGGKGAVSYLDPAAILTSWAFVPTPPDCSLKIGGGPEPEGMFEVTRGRLGRYTKSWRTSCCYALYSGTAGPTPP